MNGRLLFPILLGLLLTTSLAILVPMHSDDYANALNTLSWDIVRHKYLAWSGRLVADILSPILASLPHGIKAALTGAVLTVLIYTTSTLVPRTAQEERFTPAIFCLLFLSYWIFNPALGEGTFWIIGSANYMWPLLFCAFFIKYTLHFVTTRDNRHFVLACIFALPAGCSNEAASVGTVSFIALATLLNWKDLEIRKRMLTLFLVCGAGAALMILAPGNQVRLSQTEWAHTPLPEKLRKHFFSRLPKILRFFSVLVGSLLLFLAWVKKNRNDVRQGYVHATEIFILCAALSGAAMVGSPWIAKRAITPIFFFLLCSLSCAARGFLVSSPKRWKALVQRGCFYTLLAIFCVQYILMYNDYRNCKAQDTIRVAIIQDHKRRGNDVAVLPDFYHTPLIHHRHQFDDWTGYAGAMAQFYGIRQVSFTDNPGFNYALILQSMDDFEHLHALIQQTGQTFRAGLLVQREGLLSTNTFILSLPSFCAEQTDTIFVDMEDAHGLKHSFEIRSGIPYNGFVYFGKGGLRITKPVNVLTVRVGESTITFSKGVTQ